MSVAVVQEFSLDADEVVMAYEYQAVLSEDRVTPELALVDPALAERARSRLPEPDDTLARVCARVQISRMASLARRNTEIPGRSARDVVAIGGISRNRRWQSGLLVGGGAAACTLMIALLVGVRVDFRGSPAGADTAVIGSGTTTSTDLTPAVETPASAPPVARRPRSTKPVPQRFTWAPVDGASVYHVELFRDSSKIFEADAERSAITIPARWVFDRKTRALEPGDYRWYVWPLVSGRRAARAIVQARLVIPPR